MSQARKQSSSVAALPGACMLNWKRAACVALSHAARVQSVVWRHGKAGVDDVDVLLDDDVAVDAVVVDVDAVDVEVLDEDDVVVNDVVNVDNEDDVVVVVTVVRVVVSPGHVWHITGHAFWMKMLALHSS